MEYSFTAWVAELVYAADSKSAGRKALRVQVSPQAHIKKYEELFSVFFVFLICIYLYYSQTPLKTLVAQE